MFDALVGQSPSFVSLLREARWVAASDANVLLIGETGTGKTALARALQQHSPRAKQAFVSRNCAALPVSLAAPVLFGEDRNADPGATNHPAGWLAAAHGGMVFLDEVDALPAPLQAKLLQFLETGALPVFGHASSQQVDVRFIATSHPNSHDCFGLKLRRELRSRLRHPVVSLEVPPLRERSGDVQLLISHFSERFSTTHKLPGIALSKTAMSRLASYSWPGNVRELRSVCERLCILQAGRVIEESHLPAEILCRIPARTFAMALPASGVNLGQLERDLIRQALERTNGNRTRSAKLLSISRDALSYRMQKHGIGPGSGSLSPTGASSSGLNS